MTGPKTGGRSLPYAVVFGCPGTFNVKRIRRHVFLRIRDASGQRKAVRRQAWIILTRSRKSYHCNSIILRFQLL